jgi:hypothetical protein
MVDGRWLMRDGRITAFDEAAAIAAAKDAMAGLRECTKATVDIVTEAIPGLAAKHRRQAITIAPVQH